MPRHKLTITTIRHNLTDVQLSECMAVYQTEEGQKRVDFEALAKNGVSRKTVPEHGYNIETVVRIEME